MNKITILSKAQIAQKLTRMAYEIWEQNSDEKEITFIGIESGGMIVAKNLADVLKKISPLKIEVLPISINKNNPLKDKDIKFNYHLNKKILILVDDVANSGKTLLYALKPILDYEPSKIKVAVLVDRKHKNFPITPDIIGHSVSTTLQDKIIVTYDQNQITGAYLE